MLTAQIQTRAERVEAPHRQLADLELRHRRRTRVEDSIRVVKDTGLRNLPLHDLDKTPLPARGTGAQLSDLDRSVPQPWA